MDQKSLYERLGGYDGITAFTNDLLSRLQPDSQLGRFWENRGDEGLAREKKVLINYLTMIQLLSRPFQKFLPVDLCFHHESLL